MMWSLHYLPVEVQRMATKRKYEVQYACSAMFRVALLFLMAGICKFTLLEQLTNLLITVIGLNKPIHVRIIFKSSYIIGLLCCLSFVISKSALSGWYYLLGWLSQVNWFIL